MLGMGMSEGILSEWLAEDGAQVEEGTPIYALETDKSVQEVECPASGVLRISGKVGETYPVGELIGTIE
ncbi:MAG: biotin/lipoyl attachment protein [Bradyrhizobium sp.]|nr:biotin/lipoyl attachment protein [Bradyrhizobium sp.]